MKRIFKDKRYRVTKYTKDITSDCGILSGEDVHLILKGYKYDEMFELYYNGSATVGYDVQEV